MPYEGEFAAYKPLQRIAETERVKSLLKKSRVYVPSAVGANSLVPEVPPTNAEPLPIFVAAIDGSWAEVDVRNGYPGAKVGYCTVASVLLDLAKVNELDASRPIDPMEFRKTEEASTLDAAMPGCNVVTRNHSSAIDSFREAFYDNFHDVIVDPEDGKSLLDTYEYLMTKHSSDITCPYSDRSGCGKHVSVGPGLGSCAVTDANQSTQPTHSEFTKDFTTTRPMVRLSANSFRCGSASFCFTFSDGLNAAICSTEFPRLRFSWTVLSQCLGIPRG